jgi:hypothetical protein
VVSVRFIKLDERKAIFFIGISKISNGTEKKKRIKIVNIQKTKNIKK